MQTEILNNWLNFRKMISFSFVKYMYIGVTVIINIACLIIAILMMFAPGLFSSDGYNFFRTIGHLILLVIVTLIINLIWRLICEKAILMFSIHEMLSKLTEGGEHV